MDALARCQDLAQVDPKLAGLAIEVTLGMLVTAREEVKTKRMLFDKLAQLQAAVWGQIKQYK